MTFRFHVDIRSCARPGKVKAYADVVCESPDGLIKFYGLPVIQVDGKPVFVGFPSKPGNIPGKYFPVVEAEGAVREAICKAVLDAYRVQTEQQ